jgi:RHS repeat-associated protein
MSRHPQHGLLTGTTLGDVTDSITHNDFGEVEEYTASYDGTPVLEIEYERDQVGRIVKKTESIQGEPAVETHYQYDMAGRLYRVCEDELCNEVCAEYQYDLNSNRIDGFTPSGAIDTTYDTQDRLLAYNGATFSYTANGELQSKTEAGDTTTYQYDALGNLRGVVLHAQDPNEAIDIDYVIDGQNRRIGKKVNGTLVQGFLYENQLRPVADLDGQGNVVSRFVYGEKVNVPEYVVKGGATYRIITDHLGSPRAVVNVATGVVVQRMQFDKFGNVLTDTNPGFQPFGFAGGIWDQDTKLTRFGARDYDARSGRWTLKDPKRFGGDDSNLYGYVLADPLSFTDPEGRNIWGFFFVFVAVQQYLWFDIVKPVNDDEVQKYIASCQEEVEELYDVLATIKDLAMLIYGQPPTRGIKVLTTLLWDAGQAKLDYVGGKVAGVRVCGPPNKN